MNKTLAYLFQDIEDITKVTMVIERSDIECMWEIEHEGKCRFLGSVLYDTENRVIIGDLL